MQIKKRNFILILAGVFFAGLIVMGAICATIMHTPGYALKSDDKLSEIKGYIDKYYLNDYNEQDLVNGAYEGYVSGLGDPYSAYMTKEVYESWIVSGTGNYSGVGITFSENESGNFEVISINPGSPAEKAGVEPGDLILKVDDKAYTDSDIMASAIRGKKGTDVKLTMSHKGKEKEITMTRDEIIMQSVTSEMLDDSIGYIKIDSFIDNTGEDFSDALDKIEEDNAKGLILDLRNNGGGLVDESVEIADEFLDEGVVCYVEDKNGNTETYDAVDGRTKIPTVVLINEGTASASEILAGALKDNGFEILGTKSFGKGIIQTTFEMDDGTALKLTIMQYLSPNKNVIHQKGINPTVKVKDKEKTEVDEQLEKAKELLN
ncbi:MAG: S41 family peptidase [Clostridiales bacterium]|nr:S41 family peptidase [Clostridiales bacterium]